MKTDTKTKILKMIHIQGKARPRDLYLSLGLSPQVVHRHLKDLVAAGLLEVRGSPPFTHYAWPGLPDLAPLSRWIEADHLTTNPTDSVCETREILAGRLPRLKDAVSQGLKSDLLPLVIATAGEVGNNSFDHNLGQWRDVPGCWFESQISGGFLWVLIADRGQGILRSLSKVHPEFTDDQSALKAAYESIISGRAPEQRGNGLKYVRTSILRTSGSGVGCASGRGRVQYGDHGADCRSVLDKFFKQVQGTVTVISWGLK